MQSPNDTRPSAAPTARILVTDVALLLALLAGTATTLLGSDTSQAQTVSLSGPATTHAPAATPVNLIPNYTTPASYFSNITRFPAWQTVPVGSHVFKNVPLQIDGMICLWGEGNATKHKIEFPEKISGIQLDQKFAALYVYHACFFTSPPGTPVCEIVFNYEDGSAATNQMCYGADMVDWVQHDAVPPAGPTATRSKLAWVGGALSPQNNTPLQMCLTAIENPHPSLRVKTVDLQSCKSRTAPCIMAMTTGPAGIMK